MTKHLDQAARGRFFHCLDKSLGYHYRILLEDYGGRSEGLDFSYPLVLPRDIQCCRCISRRQKKLFRRKGCSQW